MGIKKKDTLKCPLCGKRFALYSLNKYAGENGEYQHGYHKVRDHILKPSWEGGCKSPKALEYSQKLDDWDSYRNELDAQAELERTETFDLEENNHGTL